MTNYLKPFDSSIDKTLQNSNYSLEISCFSNDIFKNAENQIAQNFKNQTKANLGLFNFLQSLKEKKIIEVVLDEETKKNLKSGKWTLKTANDGSGILPMLYGDNGKIVKQVRLQKFSSTTASANAMYNLAIQQSLKEINEKINEVVVITERIEQGQRNDRLSLVFNARQLFFEAININDTEVQRIALINTISTANDARHKLMMTLRTDCDELKEESKKTGILNNNKNHIDSLITNIEQSYKAIGFTTQLIASIYNILNENKSMIISLKLYEHFLLETLLEKKDNELSISEVLHMNCNNNSNTDFWIQFPTETKIKVEQIINDQILYENNFLCNYK